MSGINITGMFRRARRIGNLSVECFSMSNMKEPVSELERIQLEERLREVDERLRSEMLARGFDPDQGENMALTAPLAKLYMERESLRAQLETPVQEEN